MEYITKIITFEHRAPFDLSLCTLIFMAAIMMCTWGENYGNETGNLTLSFKEAITVIRKGKEYCTVILHFCARRSETYTVRPSSDVELFMCRT